MLTCREVTERADEYIDGELGFWPAMHVRMHLVACRYCRRFIKQLRTVGRLVKEYGYTLPPEMFDEDLMDAFRRRNVAPNVPVSGRDNNQGEGT